MNNSEELGEFLASRRARISPEQARLSSHGQRRVSGLRRTEVAQLAGISVEWYTRLERGKANGASDSVLDALARALQLDEAERAHLFDLARALSPSRHAGRRRGTQGVVRPGVQHLLDAMTDVPAVVRNGRLDLLAANTLGRALFAHLAGDIDVHGGTRRVPNFAWYIFLDARSHDFYLDWNGPAGDTVASLRAEAGRNPDDRALNELIGELATRSERFATLWATHNVRSQTTGAKHIQHPVVGELSLAYEAMEMTADPGQSLVAFTAQPGSPSEQSLAFLAS